MDEPKVLLVELKIPRFWTLGMWVSVSLLGLAMVFWFVVQLYMQREFGRIDESLARWKAEDAKTASLNLKTEETKTTPLFHDDGSVFKSDYAYSDGYLPRSVAAQVAILREHFPQLGSFDENLAMQFLPRGAEANFAMPKWQKIDPDYPRAVQKMLGASHLSGEGFGAIPSSFSFDGEHLVSIPRTVNFRGTLYSRQGQHDIVVVPAQFGGKYAGRSPSEIDFRLPSNEFVFGAFELAVYYLTHPERLRSERDAGLIAVGDECCLTRPGEGVVFNMAPCLLQKSKSVLFSLQLKHNSFASFGSPTCFLSE